MLEDNDLFFFGFGSIRKFKWIITVLEISSLSTGGLTFVNKVYPALPCRGLFYPTPGIPILKIFHIGSQMNCENIINILEKLLVDVIPKLN